MGQLLVTELTNDHFIPTSHGCS